MGSHAGDGLGASRPGGFVEPGEDGGWQAEAEPCKVAAQLADGARADDDGGDARLAGYPGEGDAGRGGAEFGGHRGDVGGNGQVALPSHWWHW